LGVGARKTGHEAVELGASAELGVNWGLYAGFNGKSFARIGYESPVDGWAGISGLSVGLGFALGGFGMDYGYRLGSVDAGGGVWSVSAKLEFESLKRRSADDNLALARRYFYDKGRYDRAVAYSRRALAADSAYWAAWALLNRSESEARRVRGRDIAIIYGGNSRGTIIPYPPSPDALGGLSRYAAVVSALRREWPVSFVFDAGNMMGAGRSELTVELAAAYYDIMGFDAVAPGEGEMRMGPFEFAAAQRRALPLVITNLNDNNSAESGIWGSLLLANGEYSVYLINLICESAAGDSGALDMSINTAAVRAQLTGPRAAGADLRVAVIHGTLAEIKRMAEALPELDVIIAGGLEQRFDTPLMAGRTHILSAGEGNRFVGHLTVNVNRDGRRRQRQLNVTNRLHPVYQSVVPNPAVERVTGLVSAAILIEESGPDMIPVRVSGVIPHLSERGGGTQAFIKAVESLNEHPLCDGGADARQPTFSPHSNRAAFIRGKSESMGGTLMMADMGTMNVITVSAGGNVIEATFSPTNNFLYYLEADSGSESGAIYKTKIYMYDAIPVLKSDGAVRRDLSVSEDGTTLFFSSRSGNSDRWQIYAFDTSGASPPVRLTAGPADSRLPRMSPDGRFIAYLSNRDAFGGRMDLWVLDRARKNHRRLTVSANVQEFSWGDDSETLYFTGGPNVSEINSISIAENITRKLIPPPVGAAKVWSENTPRFIRYNGAPRIVYTREYLDGQRRLHWFDVIEGTDAKLYAVGEYDEWLD
jgi:tetratricopeptide (TPR) repeat protein